MFLRLFTKQILRLSLPALFVVAGFGGCALEPGDPAPENEPEGVESMEQGLLRPPETLECSCGKQIGGTVACSDSCFESVSCNTRALTCADACLYKGEPKVGEDCVAVTPKGEGYEGLCAAGGVFGIKERPGCCEGCIYKSSDTYLCAPGNTVTRCGAPGEICKSCSNECLQPTCEKGQCVPVENGKSCSGGAGKCNNGSCCMGCILNGACVTGTAAGACGTGGAACASCDDGNACNGVETCDAGSCKAGTAPVCNDGNPCTDDECDPAVGCIQPPTDEGTACNDAKACTQNDECDGAGTCAGTVSCDDGEPCTDDGCDSNGQCANTPVEDDTDCDDGSSCTEDDVCTDGECAGTVLGGQTLCHDNSCQVSDCDGGDCVVVNKEDDTPCDDGDKCTIGDTCQGGMCEAGDSVECDDNNSCTDDSCEAATGCVFDALDGGECADGDACTERDRCVEGECVGQDVECNALDCFEASSCDSLTGLCAYSLLDDGEDCEGGSCEGSVCVVPEQPEEVAGGGAAGAPDLGAGGDSATNGAGGEGGSEEAVDGETGERGRLLERPSAGCACRTQRSSTNGVAGLGTLLLLGIAFGRRRR
jgi:MYXO-CTERM domain-containing protein